MPSSIGSSGAVDCSRSMGHPCGPSTSDLTTRPLLRHYINNRPDQARQIFRDLVDTPATVEITATAITVAFHRRAHLPILMASGLFDAPIRVPWWDNRTLRLTSDSG